MALFAPGGTALGAADASCTGIALSEHGAAIHEEVKPLAEALGLPMGAVMSAFARERLGSHEACEAVFGG
ncbi:MAG: hypothetical protein K6T92_06820 [Candidatus Rokubacteria bacterium]|nr:hypothetical protein [Candidatus Rokubacteria bacterium]